MHGSLPRASCSAGAGGGGDVRSAGFDDEKWVGFRGVGCWIGAINFPPGLLGPGLCMHGSGGSDGAGSVYLYASAACKEKPVAKRVDRAHTFWRPVQAIRAMLGACVCERKKAVPDFAVWGQLERRWPRRQGERSMSAVATTVDATADGCCVRCLRSGKPIEINVAHTLPLMRLAAA